MSDRPIIFRSTPGGNPCPVCVSSTKGCSATDDGLHLCRGVPDASPPPGDWREIPPSPDANGFRHFRLVGAASGGGSVHTNGHRSASPAILPISPPAKPNSSKPSRDWSELAQRFASGMVPDRRQELADRLRVPVTVIAQCPLIGVEGYTADEGFTFTFPEYDGAGRVIGILRRLPVPDRRSGKDKLLIAGGKRGLFLIPGWDAVPFGSVADPAAPIYLTEGSSDALALTAAGLPAVARANDAAGLNYLTELLAHWPTARPIIVVADNDLPTDNGKRPGQEGAAKVARELAQRLNRPISYAVIPESIRPTADGPARGKDARDWLADPSRSEMAWPDRGRELAAVLAAVSVSVSPASPSPASSPPPSSPGGPAGVSASGRPQIVQSPAQLRDVVDAILAALVTDNTPYTLFVHGNCLVVVEPGGEKPVRVLTLNQVGDRCSRAADFFKEVAVRNTIEYKPVFPAEAALKIVHDHHHWPNIPRLKAVYDVPVFTRTKESASPVLISTPGYHAESGIYLLPSAADIPPINPLPNDDDIADARTLLLSELLGGFPFDDPASRANCIALFLLPFVRDLIDGPTPLHHVDAPAAGTGKGLLVNTWGQVTLGYEPAAITEVTKADEWAKTILSILIEAPRCVFLDNINRTLDSGALASALTESVFSGRLLNFSRQVSAPVRCVWVSAANNLSTSTELIRRVIHIRLDANSDSPYEGRSFRHVLPRWAVENRPALVNACLTLIQSWVAAGAQPGRELLGRFESWSKTIDGILTHVGIPDLLGNRAKFRAKLSTSRNEWAAFVELWHARYGAARMSARELKSLAKENDLLSEVFGRSGTENGEANAMSKSLRKQDGTMYGTLRVQLLPRGMPNKADAYQVIDTNNETVSLPLTQENSDAI